MKLLKLKLTNFEGIGTLEISPNGKSMTVYGDNGTGKTTIADAQSWLLFSKDSTFTANFSPKMRDKNGEEIHNIDCSVQAVYELNGIEVALEKTMREDWKKKRGSSEAVFSGHTIAYSIDGVPKKEKEFNDFVSSIADLQTVMLLSVPKYFPEILDIKKRRAMLMALTSDINDFDVINSDDELKPLLHLMLKPGSTQLWYGIDEFLKISKANASEANARLKEIPGRIDEVNKTIHDNKADKTLEEIKSSIAALTAQRTALQIKLGATESQMINEISEDISKAQLELVEKKAAYAEKDREKNDAVLEKISGLTSQKYQIMNAISSLESQKEQLSKQIDDMNKERSKLIEAIVRTQSETWQGDTICPTCGQAIPQEQIDNAMAQFNIHKSQTIEELNAHGREHCSKDMIAKVESDIKDIGEKLEVHKAALKKVEQDIALLSEKRLAYSEPFENTPEYIALNNKVETMKSQIVKLRSSDDSAKKAMAEEIVTIDGQISKLNAMAAKYDVLDSARQRMAELERHEKKLAESYAKAQQGVELCELFSRVKADMLTDKINSKFKNVRFRLFKMQINGGIADDCEVMALTSNGYIPYSTANNAAKINAGLEIIRTFSEQAGVTMPVFVDNAESVTKLDSEGLQIIRLVVSENDKTLRFETEEC